MKELIPHPQRNHPNNKQSKFNLIRTVLEAGVYIQQETLIDILTIPVPYQ